MRAKHASPLFLLSAVMCVTGGCMTLSYDAPATPLSFAPPAKHMLAVDLHLSEELRQAKWEGDPGPIFVGRALEANSEALARALFSDVAVIKGGQAAAPGRNTLTPRVVTIARDRPAMGYNDQTTNIFLLWELKDRDGRLVWVETINGEGKAALIKADEQVNAALTNLFQQSLQAMAQSVEIRRLASLAPQ